MDVFTKYFRRLLSSNVQQIWNLSRTTESSGSYQILVSEMSRISSDPTQAAKIAESIDQGDGEIFKDFDISTVMDHFKLSPFAKVTLATAFKKLTKQDLRTKADAIISNNLQNFLQVIATPAAADSTDHVHSSVLTCTLDRLAQYPPRNWNNEIFMALLNSIQQRYQTANTLVPIEITSALLQFELLSQHNPLARLLQRSGPKATESQDACKNMLESAELQDISYQQVANCLLFMVIAKDDPPYNPKTFISALREHRGGQRLDWQDVVHAFDRDGIQVTKQQFKGLFDSLIPLSQEYENFDIQLLWGGDWHHQETQLSFAAAFLSFNEEEIDASQIPRLRKAFTIEDFKDASEAVQAHAKVAVRHPLVSIDATKALFNMVFRSSDTYTHAQSMGVIENVINPKMDLFVCSVSCVPKPWGALQDQAMKQLITPFFYKNSQLAEQGFSHEFVFHILWQRDKTWLIQRLLGFYQNSLTNILFIYEHALQHGFLKELISVTTDMSIELACLAHGRNVFELEPWLKHIFTTLPNKSQVLRVISTFLEMRAEDDKRLQTEQIAMTTVPLTVKTVHVLLRFLGDNGQPEDEQVRLQRVCIASYPRLVNYGEGYDDIIDANGQNGNAMSSDADAKMQEHYKIMYNSESRVNDIIETLQKYKTSKDPAEQDLFACMIYGLFDEYTCFEGYPRDALATTAVLFGSIINFNLLSRIALQVALAMVLEAVRDSLSTDDSMYKFGLQALLHFQDRLDEWKIFSERLLQVPLLKNTHIEEKVSKIVLAQGSNGLRGGIPGVESDSFASEALESRFPEFTSLVVDPPNRSDFYEEPDDDVKENVLFILNNISERNMDIKFADLQAKLKEQHHQWFAHYLVEQRIKPQPNFQPLYMDLLNNFDDKTLWAEVLRETYISAFKMLNAESTMNSSSERTLMKNLANWLGSLTIARNKPIQTRNISFKDLLMEANDSQRLQVIIPFTCNVLSTAAKSDVFKPDCAWTMEILEILVELYEFAGLKLQLKFEIEILCKALGTDHKQIEPSDVIRQRPISDVESIPPALPDGLEGFGDLSLVPFNRRGGLSERLSPGQLVPEIQEVGPRLVHNYPMPSNAPMMQERLKQLLVQAVERAVGEIVWPVVERSVTIATLSASQLVDKDLALEPDADRFQEAAHNIAKNLAGSLALVTCKEPLRSSIQTNIRVLMANDLAEQSSLAPGSVILFVNDNLDNVCKVVEEAAEKAAIKEIDYVISEPLAARRNGTYAEPSISQWAFHVPEPFKPARGGLNRDQVAIYEEFGRSARAAANHNLTGSQESVRQLPDILQDSISSIPGLSTPAADAGAMSRQPAHHLAVQQASLPQSRSPQHMLNGYGGNSSVQERVRDASTDLFNVAKKIAGDSPNGDLTQSGAVDEAFVRLRTTILQNTPPDAMASVAAEHMIRFIYQDQLRSPVVELLAKVVRHMGDIAESTRSDIFYALRSSEARLFNPIVTAALLRNRLVDVAHIDLLTSLGLRDHKPDVLDFFRRLVDSVLLCISPPCLRGDFSRSISAIAEWLYDDSTFPPLQEVAHILQDETLRLESPLAELAVGVESQADYVFEEWVSLVYNKPSTTSLSSFLHQIQQKRLIASREDSAIFFRVWIDASVAGYEREESISIDRAYLQVDALAKMIVLLAAHQKPMNGTKIDKVSYFEGILSLISFVLASHYQNRAERFNQKVFFRLFSSILAELGINKAFFVDVQQQMYSAFAKRLILLQPKTFPAFAFAWVSLMSHRMLIPALLRSPEQGWNIYCDLLTMQTEYIGELMKSLEISIPARDLYRAATELLLLLRHDFPEFLAENHFQIVNSIPPFLVQMRNIVISAPGSSFQELPDPFVDGLKIDRLPETRRAPVIRGDVEKYLQDAGIKHIVDSMLDGSKTGLDVIVHHLTHPLKRSPGVGFGFMTVDENLMNALVIYIAKHSLNSGAPTATFATNSPHAHLLQGLIEQMQAEARYHFVGAMANQLRFPNSHTHFFSYAILHLFRAGQMDELSTSIQSAILRVLVEREIGPRPHPWGLLVTLLELIKNRDYQLMDLPFVKATPEVSFCVRSLLVNRSNLKNLGGSHVPKSPPPNQQ